MSGAICGSDQKGKSPLRGTEKNKECWPMSVDRNMRILVVDDAQTMRRIIVNLLRQLGFTNMTEADDGTTAWDKLNAEHIDMVISDWNMPKMTGIDLLKKVRESEKYKLTPFIMVTAEGKRENVIAAVQAGVSNYIVKPFNAATLKEKMTKVIGMF
jgi:two-component system, chemotaxis family, chemotaxis protein CheY